VDPARLVFAQRLPAPEDHLARLGLADLFLDTLPYNAHTTAMDALWAGLPVLTSMGDSFASRVAASLLHAAGLSELVTGSLGAYEQKAIALAREPDAAAKLKAKLAANREHCALFDTALFTRGLERAYHAMWLRAERGQPAEAFHVEEIARP
jgi:predicted O-linked N-acetylglucosamine transferase (SPINDLY family)